jgi:hypothetical protein
MDKRIVMIAMLIGSSIGWYMPLLFGFDALSWQSIIGSAVGGVGGIWLSVKLMS